MNLGQRLKIARKAKGITQDGLAHKIGASRGVITNIEHDLIETPQPIVLNALCEALEINQEWLLNGTGTMEDNKDLIKSAHVLSAIQSNIQNMTEDEQLYILDLIQSYKEHISQKESN